jgi:UPF0755 protein
MRRATAVLIGLIALVAVLAWTAVWLSTPGAPADATFVGAQGDGVEKIVTGLKARGFVRSILLFKVDLRSSGMATRLQPGSYDLSGVKSYEDIIARLASGGVAANEFTLKIIEGWDLRDIEAALKAAGYARAGELYRVTGLPATDARELNAEGAAKPADLSASFPFLKEKPPYVNMEGYLFPDTYRIYKDASPEELVRVLLGNFDRKVTPELRAKVAVRGRTLFQVVTMASIVEREVRTPDDRRKVADIFWRRLQKGMALQADSTVNYAVGKSAASSTYEDTRVVSRYNTYKYPGLPLGPISEPGLDAIEAAADPAPNPYWYFLTDKDGGVHYAATLDEHDRNKAKYLR